MDIRVEFDARQLTRFAGELKRQAPFAMSVALNHIANDAQRAIQDSLSLHFTLRRSDFIRRTIKRERTDFARKDSLIATVRVDPQRDILAKFEEGGVKTPREGRHITIPTTNVRRTKTDIIAKSARPRALFANPRGKVRIVRDLIVQTVGRGKAATSRVLYVLRTSVKIPKRLNFEKTAVATFERVAEKRLGEALDRAISTATK